MEQNEEMERRLWAYIDGEGSAAERSAIAQLIAENEEWKAQYSILMSVQEALGSLELEQPGMRFSRNVMEEITRLQIAPATRQYINKKVIWGIGAFFAVLICGFLVYAFSQVTWSSGSSESSAVLFDFARVDYSAIFSNQFVNAFMLLNIILGLMLLDRYLAQQKRRWQRQ